MKKRSESPEPKTSEQGDAVSGIFFVPTGNVQDKRSSPAQGLARKPIPLEPTMCMKTRALSCKMDKMPCPLSR